MIVGVIAKHTVANTQKGFIQSLIQLVQKDSEQVIIDENIAGVFGKAGKTREQVLEKADLILVLGGDGTMLKVAGCLPKKEVSILGVNFGNKGFLTSIMPDQIEKAWKAVLMQQHRIKKLMLLSVELYRNDKKIHSLVAMNEAVINQGSFARLIELTMKENDCNMVSFKADGMIIATPTGSTAHSLSAGGPIVHQDLSAFIVTPICPASLTLRPIVIPSSHDLTITIATERQKNQNIGLTIDGQITTPVEYGDQVKISKSKHTMNLVVFEWSDYYELLRDKIGWGIR